MMIIPSKVGATALFDSPDNDCWFLLHEADVDRNYCGSKLSNIADKSSYKITFPDPKDGNGLENQLPPSVSHGNLHGVL